MTQNYHLASFFPVFLSISKKLSISLRDRQLPEVIAVVEVVSVSSLLSFSSMMSS
jgi:hypothetical protein